MKRFFLYTLKYLAIGLIYQTALLSKTTSRYNGGKPNDSYTSRKVGKAECLRGQLWPWLKSINVGDIIFGKSTFSVVSDTHPLGVAGHSMYRYDKVDYPATNFAFGKRVVNTGRSDDLQGWATPGYYNPSNVFMNFADDCWDCVIADKEPAKDKLSAYNNLMYLGDQPRWKAWKAFLTKVAPEGKWGRVNDFIKLWFCRQYAVQNVTNSWFSADTKQIVTTAPRLLSNALSQTNDAIHNLASAFETLQGALPQGSELPSTVKSLLQQTTDLTKLDSPADPSSSAFLIAMNPFKANEDQLKTPSYIVAPRDFDALDIKTSTEDNFFGAENTMQIFGLSLQGGGAGIPLRMSFSLASKTKNALSPYLLYWQSSVGNPKAGKVALKGFVPTLDGSQVVSSPNSIIAQIAKPDSYQLNSSATSSDWGALSFGNFFNPYALFMESGRYAGNNFFGLCVYPGSDIEQGDCLWSGAGKSSISSLYAANSSGCKMRLSVSTSPYDEMANQHIINPFMPRKVLLDDQDGSAWILGADYKIYLFDQPKHNLMPWRTAAYDFAVGITNIATLEAFFNMGTKSVVQIINVASLSAAKDVAGKTLPVISPNSSSSIVSADFIGAYDTLFNVDSLLNDGSNTAVPYKAFAFKGDVTTDITDTAELPNSASKYTLTIDLSQFPVLFNPQNDLSVFKIDLAPRLASNFSLVDELVVLTTPGNDNSSGKLYHYSQGTFQALNFNDINGRSLGMVDNFSMGTYADYGVVARQASTGALYLLIDLERAHWASLGMTASSFAVSASGYLACSDGEIVKIYKLSNLIAGAATN